MFSFMVFDSPFLPLSALCEDRYPPLICTSTFTVSDPWLPVWLRAFKKSRANSIFAHMEMFCIKSLYLMVTVSTETGGFVTFI